MKRAFLCLLAILFLHSSAHAAEPDDVLFGGLGCKRLARIAARRGENLPAGNPKPSLTVQYGSAAGQEMDVFLPLRKYGVAAGAPVIIMVHGGAWCIGDKASVRVTKNKTGRWLPKGFIFVSVNYRMLPDGAGVMTQAGDVAQAIAYVQRHAAEWNGDAGKIILVGHSAGAHLVSLLGADPGSLKPWLGTVSLDSAAMDVAAIMKKKHAAFYDDAFGRDKAAWAAASPLMQLSGRSIPWLGVCSSRRKDSCAQAHAFAAKAASLGVKAEVLEENLKHGEINEDLGAPGAYTDAVETFMRGLDPAIAARL